VGFLGGRKGGVKRKDLGRRKVVTLPENGIRGGKGGGEDFAEENDNPH